MSLPLFEVTRLNKGMSEDIIKQLESERVPKWAQEKTLAGIKSEGFYNKIASVFKPFYY
jgi:hypothetical protein